MTTVDTYKVHITNPGDIGGGAGNATAANQTTEISKLDSILTKLADPATQATLVAVLGAVDGLEALLGGTGVLGVKPLSATPTVTNATSNNFDMVGNTDVTNYRSGSFQVAGFGSATVQVQFSNDGGTTWVAQRVFAVGSNISATNITTAGLVFFAIPTVGLLRIRTTAYSSGTITGALVLSSLPPPFTLVTESNGLLALGVAANNSDGQLQHLINDTSANARPLAISKYAYIANNSWDRERTPTTFKTATATASGNTALWTPTSSKKFRLMRLLIEITGEAATSGGASIDVTLQDATSPIGIGFSVFVPGTGVTTTESAVNSGWIDLGNGFLSAAANNVLNINLSAALTAGKVRVTACGTEE